MPLQLSAGDVFAQFRIERVLRKLPDAWVYLARVADGALVDLKVSLHPVGSEEVARRVLRELAVLGHLTNHHVVEVKDSGLGPGEHWYIASEHLEGAQLHHWHDFDVPLPAADAVAFVHDACLGLAELHAAGIVHRALEPGRMWVMPDRTLKIMDFTAARSWGAEPTGDNVTVGTVLTVSPQYAAPEQVAGGALTPAADVYSLGVILYEMLSGRSPLFPDKTWRRARAELADDPGAWLRAHVKQPAAPLLQHPACARLPAALLELVDGCIRKDPSARPVDAAALANALGWILHAELGAAQVAVLNATRAGSTPQFHLIVPGSHRIDARGAPLRDGGEVAFVLDWDGAGELAELVPEGAALTIDGAAVVGRTRWPRGASARVGEIALQLAYPRARS